MHRWRLLGITKSAEREFISVLSIYLGILYRVVVVYRLVSYRIVYCVLCIHVC